MEKTRLLPDGFSLKIDRGNVAKICGHILMMVKTEQEDTLRKNMTFVYPCIASIIVNDDQQDATILAYLFIPNQLYMRWNVVPSHP